MKNIFKWVMLGLACATMVFGTVSTILTTSVESSENAIAQTSTISAGAALTGGAVTAGDLTVASNRVVNFSLNKDGKIIKTEAEKTAMGDNWNADLFVLASDKVETISAKQAVKRTMKMYKIVLKQAEKGTVGTETGDKYATQAIKDTTIATLKASIGSMNDAIAKDNIEVFTATAGTFFFTYMIAAGVLLVGFVITSRE